MMEHSAKFGLKFSVGCNATYQGVPVVHPAWRATGDLLALSIHLCGCVQCSAVQCMEWLREGQELDAEKRAHMVHRWCTMVGNI